MIIVMSSSMVLCFVEKADLGVNGKPGRGGGAAGSTLPHFTQYTHAQIGYILTYWILQK